MLLLYIPCPSKEEAEKIAKATIDNKLAACAHIFPIQSMFMWEGSLQEGDEFVLLLKTMESKYIQTVIEIKKHHSYEIPAIISINADCNDEYKEWMVRELH